MRVAVHDELNARFDYFTPLIVRQMSLFGVYFDISAVIRGGLSDLYRVAKTKITDVSYNVDRVVFYRVYVTIRIESDEPVRRRGP